MLAAGEGHDALGVVESQLTQRYAHDYRVMCLADPRVAVYNLTELARAGQDVALVLAGMPQPVTVCGGLLERAQERKALTKLGALQGQGPCTAEGGR